MTDFLPPNYPGPDRLKEIRLSAIDADDQMRIFMQEANIEADNARSDRNTDSLIETRDARLGEYRRHNRATEGNTRRGQDITDRRGRSRGGSSRASVPTATGANGEKYELRNGKWVQIN